MRKFIAIISCAILLASCGANQKQAVAYNNSLVKIQSDVANEAVKFGQLGQAADKTKAYQMLADLSKYIDDQQKKAEALSYSGNDFGMKSSLLEGFKFFKTVLSEDYKKILDLKFATPPPADAAQQMQDIVQHIQTDGQGIDKKFMDAQQQFAKKHNILLQLQSGPQ